jgi:membrane-associated protein
MTLLSLMGLIIFLESIIYLGFYLPGQFIAVILVISSADSWTDILPLTLVSIIAVTLSAGVNYMLGLFFRTQDEQKENNINWKKFLLSMIHINTLALALFDAGKHHAPKRIIALVGLFNLPYYFLLVTITYYFQEDIMKMGENPYYLLLILVCWCGYTFYSSKRNQRIS